MKKKVLVILAVVLVAVMVLVGCESYKNATFDRGDTSAAVESNGGSIVKQGEYVYFVNGYADYQSKAQDNWFGNVMKGAIMRVKASNLEDMSGVETIVPKAVVSSAANTGFSIYGDYIYYVSPSAEEDRSGSVLNSNLQFMRTGLDGQNTQVILEIEDGKSTQYKYTSKGLVYVKDSTLYFKSTEAKKFDKKKDGTVVAEKVTVHMPINANYAGSVTTDDVVFYTKANDEGVYDYTQTLYAYMPGESPIAVIGNGSYPLPNGDANQRYKTQFSYGILGSCTEEVDGKTCVTLAYTKKYYAEAGSSTGTDAGTYLYRFDSSFQFDAAKEVCISTEALSSVSVIGYEQGVLSAESILTVYAYDFNAKKTALPRVFQDDNGKIESTSSVAITVVGFADGYVFYLKSNKLYCYKYDQSSYVNIIGSTEIYSDFIKPELLKINGKWQVVFFSNGTKCLYRYELESMKNNSDLEPVLVGVQTEADKSSSSK